MLITEITNCRSCGSALLQPVLNLGNLCVSDFILPGEQEDIAPLELVVCSSCSLVQLRHSVDRDRLYRDTPYYYTSGMNESMVKALADVVDDAMRRVHLQIEDKVCDIGCNDGTLLSFYPSFVNPYGYEPAWNLWETAKQKSRGCIYPTYFPRMITFRDKYMVITSIAQLYNVDNLPEYVKAVKHILHPNGVWVVQMQDLEGMLDCNGVDNICHEHVTYFSLPAFEHLISRYELKIEDISYNNTNGRSVRYIVKHGNDEQSFSGAVAAQEISLLRQFSANAERLKEQTIELLKQIKSQGQTVIGVAASTKANTLLQYYGITPDLLPAIADRNPEKHGRMMVGTHVPIISEQEMYERKPDYLLALAWHFADSFLARYENLPAQWIIPLPELRIIPGGNTCLSTTDRPLDKLLVSNT